MPTLAPNSIEFQVDPAVEKIESVSGLTTVIFNESGYVSYLDGLLAESRRSSNTRASATVQIIELSAEEFDTLRKLDDDPPSPAKSLTHAVRKRLAKD